MVPLSIIAALVLVIVDTAAAGESPFDGIPAKAKTFACSVGRLRSTDKLIIQVSVPHGTDIGIRTPENDFFFVYSCDPSNRSPQWKDIDCEGFARLRRISIDIATFEATTVGPQAKKRRVFSQAGAYTILLGKNLETENTEQTVNQCRVQFRPNEIAKP